MLWLHWDKFMDVKWVKIPSLAVLQVAKYRWSNGQEPLKDRTYLGKKLFSKFLGITFVAPKNGHWHEKKPVLEPAWGGLLHLPQ